MTIHRCSFALNALLVVVASLVCSTTADPPSFTLPFFRAPSRWVSGNIVGQSLMPIPYSGQSLQLGEYYVSIGVGSQVFNVQVATGSSTLVIPDVACSGCVPSIVPSYNASKSPFFQQTVCLSSDCPSRLPGGISPCANISGFAGQCEYTVSYGFGRGTTGVVAQDRITLASGVYATAYFGRILLESSGVGSFAATGILGVGYADLNLAPNTQPTVLDQLNRQTGLPLQFAMCLSEYGGAWDVGYTNTTRAAGPFINLPCQGTTEGNYQVVLSKITFNGMVVDTPAPSDIILDSGTNLIVVPFQVLYSLQTNILTIGARNNDQGYLDLGRYGCTSNLSPAQLQLFPSLFFTFSGGTVELTAENYVIAAGDQYCLAITSGDGWPSTPPYIFGTAFLQAFYTVFNKQASVVQLAPLNVSHCPGYGPKPIPVKSSGSNHTTLIVAIVVPVCSVLIIAGLVVYWRRRKLSQDASSGPLLEATSQQSYGQLA